MGHAILKEVCSRRPHLCCDFFFICKFRVEFRAVRLALLLLTFNGGFHFVK